MMTNILVHRVNDQACEAFLRRYPKVRSIIMGIISKTPNLLKGYKAFLRYKDLNPALLGGEEVVTTSPTFGEKRFWKWDFMGTSGWAEPFQYLWGKRLVREGVDGVDGVEGYRRFSEWVCEELGIQNRPQIRWYDNPLKNGNQPSFAGYDVGSNLVTVCIGGRHPMDIMRSLAHELFHAFQKERGKLTPQSGRTGDEVENHANAIAGVLIRRWGRMNPHLYEGRIREASEGDSMVQSVLKKWRTARPAMRRWISLSVTGKDRSDEKGILKGLTELWREDLIAVFKKLGLDTGWDRPLTFREALLRERPFMQNRPTPPTRPQSPRKRAPKPPAESLADKVNRQTRRVKINRDTLRIQQTPNGKRIWTDRVKRSQQKLADLKSKAAKATNPTQN